MRPCLHHTLATLAAPHRLEDASLPRQKGLDPAHIEPFLIGHGQHALARLLAPFRFGQRLVLLPPGRPVAQRHAHYAPIGTAVKWALLLGRGPVCI